MSHRRSVATATKVGASLASPQGLRPQPAHTRGREEQHADKDVGREADPRGRPAQHTEHQRPPRTAYAASCHQATRSNTAIAKATNAAAPSSQPRPTRRIPAVPTSNVSAKTVV